MMASRSTNSPDGGRDGSPSATEPAVRQELTTVELANEVVTRTLLTQVRFSEFSARARMAIGDVDDEAQFLVSTQFRRPEIQLVDEGEDAAFKATSTLVFRLGTGPLPSDEHSAVEPCVVVKATLEASYAFKDGSPDFSEEQLKAFALHYCPFHVWGYWREFVHSSLARLEFPALTVPLFQIDMAQALVVDEVDED